MECLEGRDSSVCRYTLLMEKPHIQVTFRGSVLYQTQTGHSHTLLFSDKLSTPDFIRYDLHSPQQCFTLSQRFHVHEAFPYKNSSIQIDFPENLVNSKEHSLNLHIRRLITFSTLFDNRLQVIEFECIAPLYLE